MTYDVHSRNAFLHEYRFFDVSDVQKEGVFRVSGSLERQKELREWLDNGELPSNLESKYFVHDYAAVLKNFLSELPEPLMMEKYYNVYLQIAGESCILPVTLRLLVRVVFLSVFFPLY